MAFSISQAQPWHEGEEAMHRLTKVDVRDNPSTPFLTPRAASQIQRYPLMAVGTLETSNSKSNSASTATTATTTAAGRPWVTLWGGETPVAAPVAQSVIGIKSVVDASFDPVIREIFGVVEGEVADGEVVQGRNQEGGKGKMIAALSISLEERNRVKLFGRMVVGAMGGLAGPETDEGDEQEETETRVEYEQQQQQEEEKGEGEEGNVEPKGRKRIKRKGKVGQIQLVVRIEESLGNCPKYLNSKTIIPAIPSPVLVSESPHLCPGALALLEKADTFFIASAHEDRDMDVNHRGGPRGFVRVEPQQSTRPNSNSDSDTAIHDGTVLVWPEYSGNNLYQTLGNLQSSPRAGLVIPDFDSGDVLHLTGDTEVLIGKAASSVLPHSTLAVRLRVTGARFVQQGLPFRGRETEQGASPYNPRVRYLKAEKHDENGLGLEDSDDRPGTTATLLSRDILTPTISRYRLALADTNAFAGKWKPGQYVALSFKEELDMGYSHMRDDDPTSLNDDWLRTFTVSSRADDKTNKGMEVEFELTLRNVGAVTGWLSRQRIGKGRMPVEIGVRGFAGDFFITQQPEDQIIPFIAGGIGITPLLPQLADLDLARFRLFWSIAARDVGLVSDTFHRYPALIGVTSVFLTGPTEALPMEDSKKLKELQTAGARRCELRRLRQEDLKEIESQVNEWYLCTGLTLRKQVQAWLPDKKIVFEEFHF